MGMRGRKMAVGALAALAVAACGGAASEPNTEVEVEVEVSGSEVEGSDELNERAATVVSDDGMLTLDVPAGAMPRGTQIVIETATVDQLGDLPPEVELRGPAYALEPAGLRFSKPVSVTQILAVPSDETDSTVTAVVESAGVYELAANQESRFEADGSRLVLSYDLDHFSNVFYVLSHIVTTLTPTSSEFEVGDSREFRFTYAVTPRAVTVLEERREDFSRPGIERGLELFYAFSETGSSGTIDVGPPALVGDVILGMSTVTVTCLKPGATQLNAALFVTGDRDDPASLGKLLVLMGVDEVIERGRFEITSPNMGRIVDVTCSAPTVVATDVPQSDPSNDAGGEGDELPPADTPPSDPPPTTDGGAPLAEYTQEDPIGDWLTLSEQPAPADAVPAPWDIAAIERAGDTFTIFLADACPLDTCLSQMTIAGSQIVFNQPGGAVEATLILQLEEGVFVPNLNGNPALTFDPATTGFFDDRLVFDLDTTGLPDGLTVLGAVTGSTTDSSGLVRDETEAFELR